jgi:hypothetical protein
MKLFLLCMRVWAPMCVCVSVRVRVCEVCGVCLCVVSVWCLCGVCGACVCVIVVCVCEFVYVSECVCVNSPSLNLLTFTTEQIPS